MDECSSSEDELDLGVKAQTGTDMPSSHRHLNLTRLSFETVPALWLDGRPVEITLQQKQSEVQQRLEKSIAGLNSLQQKTQLRSSFINQELRQELDWAKQVRGGSRDKTFLFSPAKKQQPTAHFLGTNTTCTVGLYH